MLSERALHCLNYVRAALYDLGDDRHYARAIREVTRGEMSRNEMDAALARLKRNGQVRIEDGIFLTERGRDVEAGIRQRFPKAS